MIWIGRPAARGWLASAVLLGTLLTPTSKSLAGVYHVYSCRIPYGPQAGEPAPVQVASGEGEEAGRWSVLVSGVAQEANRCPSDSAIAGSLAAGLAHGDTDLVTWQFDAPTDASIVKATVWRAGDADGGSGYLFWLATPSNPPAYNAFASESVFDGCAYTGGCTKGIGNTAEPLAAANKVQVPASNLGGSHLYINASCSSASCPSSGGDEQGHAVVVYVYATDIALEQTSAPTVSAVSGELAAAEKVSGAAGLDFTADDSGSGVYRAIVSVDGRVLQTPVVGQGELCREVSVPAEEQPAFLSAQPCAASANAHLSLDTTTLSDGSHRLLVQVTDAAGNATTVVERMIEVSNGSSSGQAGGALAGIAGSGPIASLASAPANGVPASAHATLTARWTAGRGASVGGPHRQRLTASFGRAETISGRLTTAGGTAIAGATIEVASRASYGGAPLVVLPSVRTDREGRFTIRVARGSSSERLRLSYAPILGGVPIASQSLRLRVRAGVVLHVTPSSVSQGQTIHLRGRVLGSPIPPGGKQVVLEAHSSGSPWLQFLVLRTDDEGRFEGSHRFRLPGPVRYWFRAASPQEADFPFAAGTSKTTSVLER